MSRQHHYLKIAPQYFNAVQEGKKTFEVRRNDRNFQLYDMLHLQEYAGSEYTGREIDCEVVYILDDADYCKEGYAVMSIKLIHPVEIPFVQVPQSETEKLGIPSADYLNAAKKAFQKACGWLSVYPWYQAICEEFVKELEDNL